MHARSAVACYGAREENPEFPLSEYRLFLNKAREVLIVPKADLSVSSQKSSSRKRRAEGKAGKANAGQAETVGVPFMLLRGDVCDKIIADSVEEQAMIEADEIEARAWASSMVNPGPPSDAVARAFVRNTTAHAKANNKRPFIYTVAQMKDYLTATSNKCMVTGFPIMHTQVSLLV